MSAYLRLSIEHAVFQIGFAVKNLSDTFPRCKPAGNVLEQHDQHKDPVEKLCCIGDRRHDGSRRCKTLSDLKGTEQKNDCHDDVHQRIDDGIHERKNGQHLQLGSDQLVVCFAEPDFFVNFTHAGFNHADAGNILLHDCIDPVEVCLQFFKQRVCLAETDHDAAHNERKRAQYNQPEPRIQPEHEKHTPEGEHGCADHAADELGHEILHLCDVVRYTGHKGACPEGIHLREGERHDVPEAVLADLVADVLSGQMNEHVVHGTAQSAENDQYNHL